MRITGLVIVLLIAKLIAIAGANLPLNLWSPIAFLWHDAMVVLLFALADHLLRRRTRMAWALYALTASYVILNIPVTRVLATPLTLPMLRAARGPLSDSILHYASWQNLTITVAMIVIATLVPLLRPRLRRRSILVTAALVVIIGPSAAARVDTQGLHRNAWSALMVSALPQTTARAASADWRAGLERSPAVPLSDLRSAAVDRNIILVSLESTAAQYLGLYGASSDVMPNLTRLAQSAIVFDHAYAVYPESIKGLFTMLCSIYPALDTSTETLAAAPCRSIALLLAAAGYRNALFHSGRFMYLGMEAVIRDRGFHTLADAGHIGGNHNSSFGVDEPATVARMLEWVDGLPNSQCFFLTYLPIAGHHPYETPEPGPDSDKEDFGRYRNALRYGDASLGALMEGIRQRGLASHTVWIVVGDHGEAFGQHPGNYGHTFHIYEENMRVPFLIAIPGIQQQRSKQVVSLIDLAPTVLDLAGIPAPAGYQGHTALDGETRTALLFADYSQTLLGLRDGRWKFIHEPASGRSKLFNLTGDPAELHDLSAAEPARARNYRDTLVTWSAAQKHLLHSAKTQ